MCEQLRSGGARGELAFRPPAAAGSFVPASRRDKTEEKPKDWSGQEKRGENTLIASIDCGH